MLAQQKLIICIFNYNALLGLAEHAVYVSDYLLALQMMEAVVMSESYIYNIFFEASVPKLWVFRSQLIEEACLTSLAVYLLT